jgi:signal transduction histidine kinase
MAAYRPAALMFSRPAFLDRLLARLPDPLSLRVQVQGWTAIVAGTFGVLLVLAATHLDARRCAEVARARAETLAGAAGTWLDGDAHAGLGEKPEQALADVKSTLTRLLDKGGHDATVRTLRPRPANKTELAAKPGVARPQALEVVIQTGPGGASASVDYLPQMGAALFDGEVKSLVRDGKIWAFAPVPDSWGAAPAIVWVEARAVAPLWRRILFPLAAAFLAALGVSFFLWLSRKHARWLHAHAYALAAGAEDLASGREVDSLAPARRAPSELAEVARSLELLRQRLDGPAGPQALAAPAESAPAASAQTAALGELTEFDLALLLQQLVDPTRQTAHARGVDVQLVYPDGVPSHLIGYPMPLYRALEGLLRQALRTTRKGQVALRVNRAGDAPDSFRLRFEVSDTGVGIPFKEQAQFADALAAAAGADPSELKDPVLLASALANALGGELAFESQPGQGSRFGFTLVFKSDGRRSGTVFMRQSAFTPAPALGHAASPVPPLPPLNGHPLAPASRPGAPAARR